MPGGNMPRLLFYDLMGFDKIIHLLSFTGLSFLMLVGLFKQYSNGSYYFNIYVLTVVSLSGYGILLEMLQWYVPSRNFELLDGLANILGVLFGRFVFFVVYKSKLV
jgi:VanZ family protein